jgi:hypothetical protein
VGTFEEAARPEFQSIWPFRAEVVWSGRAQIDFQLEVVIEVVVASSERHP